MAKIGLSDPALGLANATEIKTLTASCTSPNDARLRQPSSRATNATPTLDALENTEPESDRAALHRLPWPRPPGARTRSACPPSSAPPSPGRHRRRHRLQPLEEFFDIIERGLDASPTSEVLIEESVLGWKEYEMEVVRDTADNCIIICSIENLDPMGVHTGDSITVAPALTLTDKEYQIMRNASIAVLREIGVETGGSNVQFAVNPADGRLVVIEMNPRVSRSSALASKATGFPIAKVAAKLAVGYTLDELENDITGGATPASFEPSIDYVVTKIPRFAFEKFPGAEANLTTAMKSVGEVMAIGRTLQESLQKALRGLETGLTGLNEIELDGYGKARTRTCHPPRHVAAHAGPPAQGRPVHAARGRNEQVHESAKIDPWFIEPSCAA
jgi:carbamoyl-phosphate synthase large subunit